MTRGRTLAAAAGSSCIVGGVEGFILSGSDDHLVGCSVQQFLRGYSPPTPLHPPPFPFSMFTTISMGMVWKPFHGLSYLPDALQFGLKLLLSVTC
ncbi:hypothetical protein OUZ56_028345 [Daphnia magna]|uniref:Uncharacterized protein n=1 Tax=Daphnia magna TaxID=35525 RepID=A0ABR0B3R8_9CRUS|nr:hypothetical protein OUZ56_028345 [Daphnia magna]